MSRDFREQAQTLARQLDQESELSPAEQRRLRLRIGQAVETSGRGAWRLGGWALASVTALAAFAGVYLFTAQESPAAVRVIERPECVRHDGAQLSVTPDCAGSAVVELTRPGGASGDRVSLEAAATVKFEKRSLRLAKGRGTFRIAKRKKKRDRFELQVAAGRIVVLGTHFDVEQRADASGWVALHEGAIEFQWASNGKRERLRPGQRIEWSRAGQASTPEADAVPEAQRAAKEEASADRSQARRKPRSRKARGASDDAGQQPGASVHEVMQTLFRLRSQRRYGQAAQLLRSASKREDFSQAQRQRLSFELGVLLDDKLQDPSAACRHWQQHLKRFGRSANAPAQKRWSDKCASRSRP